jgi:peptide-methionine (R)-S-oxide reductase
MKVVSLVIVTLAALAGVWGVSALAVDAPAGERPATRPAGGPERWTAAQVADAAAGLSPEAYHVTQEDGTERPFTSELLEVKEPGVFHCVVCDLPLYDSATKYDSGTGWPSFWEEVDPLHIDRVEDRKFGMIRTEVECARCGSHLGHVFEDGPEPTGLRHCINGVALRFEPRP